MAESADLNQVPGMPKARCHACGLVGYPCSDPECPYPELHRPDSFHEQLLRDMETSDRAQWLAGYEAAKAQAAAVARATFSRGSAHTYASENADIYLAQEAACERAATRILAMEPRDD